MLIPPKEGNVKNEFCDLSYEEIAKVPERFKGFFLSPFHFNERNGYVAVPTETFKEMIDLLIEFAAQETALENAKATLRHNADRLDEHTYQELDSALNP